MTWFRVMKTKGYFLETARETSFQDAGWMSLWLSPRIRTPGTITLLAEVWRGRENLRAARERAWTKSILKPALSPDFHSASQ